MSVESVYRPEVLMDSLEEVTDGVERSADALVAKRRTPQPAVEVVACVRRSSCTVVLSENGCW